MYAYLLYTIALFTLYCGARSVQYETMLC